MILPLLDRVVLQRLESPSVTPGGIFVPDVGREKYLAKGVVIRVGPGGKAPEDYPPNIKRGDTVILPLAACGTDYEDADDGPVWIVSGKDILAKVG